MGKGLLARHIEPREAQLLKKGCENIGQSVELIEEKKAFEFPEPLEIISLEVTSNALELFTTKDKYYLSLRNLVLISAGGVKIAPGIEGTKRVLDLFIQNPRYHMRIWDATFNYKSSHLFEAEGSDFNFYRLVKKISMNAPFARESFTVKKMVNEQRCYPMEFNTVKEFENYNTWILLAYLRWDLEKMT